MDQGVCVALPSSATEGFKFFMIGLNLVKPLNQKLDQAKQNNDTWESNSGELYKLPSNSTWENLVNSTCVTSPEIGHNMAYIDYETTKN